MDQAKRKGHTPAKNHPWKNVPSSAIKKWAHEQSMVTKANEIVVAKMTTLQRHDTKH